MLIAGFFKPQKLSVSGSLKYRAVMQRKYITRNVSFVTTKNTSMRQKDWLRVNNCKNKFSCFSMQLYFNLKEQREVLNIEIKDHTRILL